MLTQVHDRDAMPEEPEFFLKNVPPELRKPPYWYPNKQGEEPATPGSQAEANGEAPASTAADDGEDDGEVFGSAKVGIAAIQLHKEAG